MAFLQQLRDDWTFAELVYALNNDWRTQINERGLAAANYGQQSVTGGDDVTSVLALETVKNANIGNAEIGAAKIASLAAITALIQDLTATDGNIENLVVQVAQIASAIIEHLAAGTIYTDELTMKNGDGTVVFNADGITGDGIPNGTITYDQLGTYLQNAIDFIAAGKAIYYQPLEPTGGTYVAGDLWFDNDAAYAAYEYDGAAWVARTADSAAYYVTYMVAGLLNAGIITADHINAVTLVGTKIYFGNSAAAHGELYATGGVTYFDMYDATPTKVASWTFNGLGFIDAAGNVTTIATTREDKTITVGAGKDYADPQDPIDAQPHFINHDITINVDAGTYTSLKLIGFDGAGKIYITEATGVSYFTVDSILIEKCSCEIHINRAIVTGTGQDIGVRNSQNTKLTYLRTTVSGTVGINSFRSQCTIEYSTISNKGVVLIANTSKVDLYSVDGTGNTAKYSNVASTIYERDPPSLSASGADTIIGGAIIPSQGLQASGLDAKFITGTPGAAGSPAGWNADGDLVEFPGGALCQVPNAPASFTNTTAELITYSVAPIKTGILNTGGPGVIITSRDCVVSICLSMSIAHSAVADVYHLELYDDGVLVDILTSCMTPANMGSTAVFNAMVSLTAGHDYTLKIRANGTSGTHTPDYTYAQNRLVIAVIA